MLSLENILWVIPGIIFIFGYNRLRQDGRIDLSGWPYVFFLVLIAAITWLPAERLITNYPSCFTFASKTDSTLLVSIFFSFLLLVLVRFTPLYQIFPIYYDDFYLKCVELDCELVLLTLKDGKAYIGILWKYTTGSMEKYESQTISIIPLQSGFRREDKTIDWNIYYPQYQANEDDDMEMIIPRSEIVTFAKFNPEVHEYFSKS